MYDNIDLKVHKTDCPGVNFLKTTPQYLTQFSNQGVNRFGEYITGYLENLKVSISESRVKIHDSSICKYFLETNFKTLSKGDTKRAIEKISDTLHLPFNLANVTRIDFAQNLIMKHKESLYYPYLGEAHYYKRLEQNNGLYYTTQKRQLVFYGKEFEQRVKKQSIPELYLSRNVLRYEMRFRKKLREQFKKPKIFAALLYDDVFYRNLLQRWKEEYLSIQKINSKLTKMIPTGSKKEFIETLALFSVLETGQPKVLSTIREWQEKGDINKKQAYDLRAAVKHLGSTRFNEQGNELIEELDKKIKEAVRYQ